MGSPIYFEVSAHTGRLQLHISCDGSRPLGLSAPMELLLLEPCPLLEDVGGVLKAGREPGGLAACGMVALPQWLGVKQLEEMLEEARGFAAEWRELRAVMKNRLHGKVSSGMQFSVAGKDEGCNAVQTAWQGEQRAEGCQECTAR
jgi:hypothetical protein